MKQLIKGGAVVADLWSDDRPGVEHIKLPLPQWLQQGPEFIGREQLLAVTLAADSDLHASGLLPHLEAIAMIAIEFPAFTDGRGFSLATQLRQYGFKGELRAAGAIILYQLSYLKRCGFDAFELDSKVDSSDLEGAFRMFKRNYQQRWDSSDSGS